MYAFTRLLICIVYKIDNETISYVICSLIPWTNLKIYWNQYGSLVDLCYLSLHTPDLFIMWVSYENMKSRRFKPQCCHLMCGVSLDKTKTLYLYLSKYTNIKFDSDSVLAEVYLQCTGVLSRGSLWLSSD